MVPGIRDCPVFQPTSLTLPDAMIDRNLEMIG
jgi:hypothetical protein